MTEEQSTDPDAARFLEAGVLWWTVKPTSRPGDWVHHALAGPGVALGLIVLWAAIKNNTLTESWATPVVIVGLLSYGWFALTRRFNRRTVTLDSEHLRAWDGPLFSLARKVSVPIAEIGPLETIEITRTTMPPVALVKSYNVRVLGAGRSIVRRLPTRGEADKIRAGLVNTLERVRRG